MTLATDDSSSTKSKTNSCPECDFTTVDPGSLTRHRKRIHGYIPKLRRSRQPKPQSEAGDDIPKSFDLRFSPYSAPLVEPQGDPSYCDPSHYDSGSSTTPPAPDLFQQTLSDSRSTRSRSPAGPPPKEYLVVQQHSVFETSSPQRMILPPISASRVSPPIDPALLAEDS